MENPKNQIQKELIPVLIYGLMFFIFAYQMVSIENELNKYYISSQISKNEQQNYNNINQFQTTDKLDIFKYHELSTKFNIYLTLTAVSLILFLQTFPKKGVILSKL